MGQQNAIERRGRKDVKEMACASCGAAARIMRGDYDFAESGLKRVRLQAIDLIVCDQCGNIDPVIPRVNDLMRLLAIAVIAKPYRLTGEEIRFLLVLTKLDDLFELESVVGG